MNKKGFAPILIILAVVAVMVVTAGIWYHEANKLRAVTTKDNTGTESINSQVVNANNSDGNESFAQNSQTSTLTQTVQGQVYENQYIKVTIPTGWVVTEANKTIYYGTKTNCTSTPNPVPGVNYYGGCVNGQLYTSTPKTEPDPSAVNITKGNYILTIDARAEQASGVEGGRFEEYAGEFPSTEAVVVEHPGGPCGTFESSAISVDATTTNRRDFYVSASDKTETCAIPTNGKTVWYVSVVGQGINYFNIPNYSGSVGWVAVMGYNSSVINSFPAKSSADLTQTLGEMTSILKTLTIKTPVSYIPPISETISTMNNTLWSSSFSEGVNSDIESCVGINAPSSTENIQPANVAMSYDMESLGPNGNTSYSLADVQARGGTIEGILVNGGWLKCNHANTTDVYQKDNELVDVDIDSAYSPFIEVTFFRLK